ncbi:transporter [Gemmata sp. JC673]|uniref:Transporter n=1 Tax=Gemmata algarum TaxID=2975278 RepID=A0ABU5EXS6_9BACT|nr:transporter [Gemmata algarum]MDY3559260.1 transporter [Gemmata algarum]
MYRALLTPALAVVLACGCVARNHGAPGEAPPKALFEWSGREPESGSEPADRSGAEPPITTERPDFTNSSRTVGRGRVQLESGYTFTTARDPVARVSSHSFPEALLRVGLLADWFEIQVGQSALSTRSAGADGVARAIGFQDQGALSTGAAGADGGVRAAGFQDLYLATKFALTEGSGWRPETAVTLQMTVPTGRRELSGRHPLPGLLYLYSWELIPDLVSLGGTTAAVAAVDDTGGTYVQLAQSLSVGYTLTERLGAFTECFVLAPAGADTPRAGPQYYFDSGLLYRVTPNFQVDARFGFGLNRRADDVFAGVGFAVRY